jgi:poly(3-hydroxybutyrate) depolymerase
VPYQGGEVAGQRGTVLSAEDTVATWAALDGGGAQVALHTVPGGGHTWPDGASVLIGQFFSAHR